MKIFSIAGWSGSGKTMLITRLIESFKAKKRRVIAVKNAPDTYTLQPEAKDTAKFLRAGADEVFLIAKNELLRMSLINAPQDLLEDLKSRLHEDDIVLMEGLYQPGIPVIEVDDPSRPQALKFPLTKLAAMVSTGNAPLACPASVPIKSPKSAPLWRNTMENKITLKVNDQVIALNPFVKKIIANVVLGAVQSLDKIPQPVQQIEISLQVEKK